MRTLASGCPDFADKIKECGGMRAICSTNYARNLWWVMKDSLNLEFAANNISEYQLEFILQEKLIDYREEKRAMDIIKNGGDPDKDVSADYEDDDDSWLTKKTAKEVFADDSDETPEELRNKLFALYDDDTKELAVNQMDRVKANYIKGKSQDTTISDIMKARYDNLTKLVEKMQTASPEEMQKLRERIRQHELGKDNSPENSKSSDTKKTSNKADTLSSINKQKEIEERINKMIK